jgi:type IV pilus assembly protein PilO
MTDTRKWSALAAVLVVAIFAASWFLLISPKRSDAADLRGKAAAKSEENARLAEQITMLQEQQKDLPTQQAQLAAMRTQIPTNPALPSLIRDLTAAGKKAGVSIDSMAPSLPVALVEAPATAVVAPTTTGDDSASSGSTEATGSTTATTPPKHAAAPTSTLFKVPLTLNVTGSYFELEQFVSKLETVRRSFLVTGFKLGAAQAATAKPGDLTIILDGRVFLSQPTTATPTTPVVAPATTTGE